jgi:hypothetical protein
MLFHHWSPPLLHGVSHTPPPFQPPRRQVTYWSNCQNQVKTLGPPEASDTAPSIRGYPTFLTLCPRQLGPFLKRTHGAIIHSRVPLNRFRLCECWESRNTRAIPPSSPPAFPNWDCRSELYIKARSPRELGTTTYTYIAWYILQTKKKKRMPPPQLPRIEELEYWGSGGEKARVAKAMSGGNGETITISTDLYERV